MRVLVVTSKAPPEYSGSGNRVLSQYKRVRERYEVKFEYITSSTERYLSLPHLNKIFDSCISFKPFSYMNLSETFKIRRLTHYLEYLLEFYICYFYLSRIIKRFDILHIVGDVALTSAAVTIAQKKRIKFVYEIVNEDKLKVDPLWVRTPPFMKKPKFDNDICTIKTINLRTRNRILELHKNACVYYYPNSVNTRLSRTLKNLKNCSKHKAKKIINISKFIPRKNQHLLISAMQYLGENFDLVLMGPKSDIGTNKKRDDLYFNSLLQLTKDLNLSDRVSIEIGFVEDPLETISEYDVFAYPSVDEAFGTTLVEASMLSVPVVASATEPAFQEFVKIGVNGYLFNGTAKDLAEKIQLAIRIDREKLASFSAELSSELSHDKSDANLYRMLMDTTKLSRC